MGLSTALPNVSDVLALEPAELAWYLLAELQKDRNLLHRQNLFSKSSGSPIMEQYRGDERAECAFREAWAWLEREGILIEKEYGSFISRRGASIRSRVDFDAARRSSALQVDTLVPAMAAEVWSSFVRGEYEIAVFRAFRLVEVSVREACNYPDDLYGIDLISKAFHEDNGPLTDAKATPQERKATANLFRGAVGLFKNPASHRHVQYFNDPHAAAELICFASALLRIVRTSPNGSEDATP